MKRLATLLFVSTAMFVMTRAAGADEFTDFRIPDHSVHIWDVTLNGSFDHQSHDDGFFREHGHFTSGRLGTSRYALRETDRGWLWWSGLASFNGSRLTQEFHDLPSLGSPMDRTSRSSGQDLRSLFVLSGGWRRYPWTVPIGIDLSAGAVASYEQEWDQDRQRQFVFDTLGNSEALGFASSRQRNDHYQVSGQGTLGMGRVRDATGIYRARLLATRLAASGLLVRPPSSAAIQKLAELFYMQSDFFVVHDRPDKFLYREVERILREDGALQGTMDAFDVFRILEPTTPFGNAFRQSGWFVGGTIRASHLHELRHLVLAVGNSFTSGGSTFVNEFHSTDNRSAESHLVAAGPSAEFHRPLGVRLQIDASTQALVNVSSDQIKRGLDFDTGVAATWIVADRWYAQTTFAHQRAYFVYKDPAFASFLVDIWSTNLSATVGYFIEDRLRLQLTGQEGQGRTGRFGGRQFDRQGRVELGLVYFVSGSLMAPDLVARQGLTTGTIGP